MKKLVLLIIVLYVSSSLYSQTEIKVNETNESIGNGSHNALTVRIYEASTKDVEKAWAKLVKSYKAKVSSKNEIFADNAAVKTISENTVDIYAVVKDKKEVYVEMVVAFDLGGAFLSSSNHPNKFKEAKKIVYDFAVETSKEAIRGQLKAAGKVLKKVEKEHADLIKYNENLHKDIEDYKEKIKEAEKNIEENIKNQETKTKEVEAQRLINEQISEREKAIK